MGVYESRAPKRSLGYRWKFQSHHCSDEYRERVHTERDEVSCSTLSFADGKSPVQFGLGKKESYWFMSLKSSRVYLASAWVQSSNDSSGLFFNKYFLKSFIEIS